MRKQRLKMEIKALGMAGKAKNRVAGMLKDFGQDTRGIGVIEIILILVVLIGLVIIFKSQLTDLLNTIFEKITSESSGI